MTNPTEERDLVRISSQYAREQRGRTWRLLISTVAVHLALAMVVLCVPFLPAQILASVLLGFVAVRLFIFYHDYHHGAIFHKSTAGRWAMHAIGLLTLAAPTVWKETHDYHHRNNARMLGSSIGSYPLVTLGIYKGLDSKKRLAYRLIRNPLTILFGLFTTFFVGMCVSPFRRSPKTHWQGPVTLAYWLLAGGAIAYGLGIQAWLLLCLVPAFVASALGSYLFYAQHNFPGAELRGRREWDFVHAALKCSSMFDMNPVMHWLTGNIGYHHIHHLNHRIPFYRLPEVYAAIPELQDCKRTSWRPRDVLACLDIAVWDPEQRSLIGFREAHAKIAASNAQAAPAK